MDTKRTITVILIMMAVVILWTPLTNSIFRWMGYDVRPQQQPQATTAPTTQDTTIASTQSTQAATPPTMAAGTPGLQAVPATQPHRTELGSAKDKDPEYPLAVRLNSVGAG